MKLNPNAVIFWTAVGFITYGIAGSAQTALMAVGIAMCVSVFANVLER